jgi:hypothetical protein
MEGKFQPLSNTERDIGAQGGSTADGKKLYS